MGDWGGFGPGLFDFWCLYGHGDGFGSLSCNDWDFRLSGHSWYMFDFGFVVFSLHTFLFGSLEDCLKVVLNVILDCTLQFVVISEVG